MATRSTCSSKQKLSQIRNDMDVKILLFKQGQRRGKINEGKEWRDQGNTAASQESKTSKETPVSEHFFNFIYGIIYQQFEMEVFRLEVFRLQVCKCQANLLEWRKHLKWDRHPVDQTRRTKSMSSQNKRKHNYCQRIFCCFQMLTIWEGATRLHKQKCRGYFQRLHLQMLRLLNHLSSLMALICLSSQQIALRL